ncbi:MAG: FAD-dependent oxidoreductase, partial [Planctomycetes bacterium]|nr:FAD-dependent oxidoreductase [Planctomycetota bacterium]
MSLRALLSPLLALLFAACAGAAPQAEPRRVDVCVYGATSAGIVAAIAAKQHGLSVALIDSDGWVGGLSTSGLGATDVGNKDAIGGLSRDFYRRMRAHYDKPASW